MASFGDALRGFGSVLNPQVAQEVAGDERQQQAQQNQIGMLMLQKKIQEQSPEYQAKLEAVKNEKLFREEVQSAGGDMAKVAGAAVKYGKPELAANIYNQQEARAARVQQAHDALEARKMELQMRIDDKALDRDQKERYNGLMADLKQQQMVLSAENAKNQYELKKLQFTTQGDKQLVQNTQKLQGALEKANLPQTDSVLGGVEDALKKTPDLSEYISGPKSRIPDMIAGKEIGLGRQAFQKLFNITLKDRSGAAVTNQELERLKQEFATGVFKTKEQLEGAVKEVRRIVDNHYTSVAAGFGPDVLEAYNENLRGLNGKVVIKVPKKASTTSGDDPLGIR